MITALKLKENQLDELYDWVDGLPMSRPKKNISRDFSDGVLMAEVIHHFYPKIIEIHNYPPGNAYKVKLSNWQTLKNKPFSKLGIHLTEDDCSRLANATPMAIEAVLYEVKRVIDDLILMHQNEQSPNKAASQSFVNNKKTQEFEDRVDVPKKVQKGGPSSKADELKQILALIKQKLAIVQKSVERKDAQIRELEQILKQAGQ